MPANKRVFTNMLMKKYDILAVLFVLMLSASSATVAEDKVCFESREGASKVTQKDIDEELKNVQCSDKTGAVLWWGDPYDGTQPMGEMPLEADYTHGEAVVKLRTDQLSLYPICGQACHNGDFPEPVDADAPPRKLTMHMDLVPDSLNLQHGNGGIWCLDCHDAKTRNKFVDNAGNLIDFNQPQELCGKCHGQVYRGWRDGMHGKRIGEWATTGKKRWFVCTECHNPHDVQQGERKSGFAQLVPESAPILPKGLENADHERHHGH